MPLIEYIEALPNYFNSPYNYDAWVYLTDDKYHQNVLGAAFRPIRFQKVDENGAVLSGVKLEIYDDSGLFHYSWISSDTAFNGTLPLDDTYNIKETTPDGYYPIPEKAKIRIKADGTLVIPYDSRNVSLSDADGTVLIENRKTSVTISKRDFDDHDYEIPDAELTLTGEANDAYWNNVLTQFSDETRDEYDIEEVEDQNGVLCGIRWLTVEDKSFTIEGLNSGVVYKLEETDAPSGYCLSEDIQFMLDIDRNGNGIVKVYQADTDSYETASSVVMYDKRPSVDISKVESDGRTVVIGAGISFYDVYDNLEKLEKMYSFEEKQKNNNISEIIDNKEEDLSKDMSKNYYNKQLKNGDFNKIYDEESEFIEKELNFYDFDEELLQYRPVELDNLVQSLLNLKSALILTSRNQEVENIIGYTNSEFTFSNFKNKEGSRLCQSNIGNLQSRLAKYDKAIYHLALSLQNVDLKKFFSQSFFV